MPRSDDAAPVVDDQPDAASPPVAAGTQSAEATEPTPAASSASEPGASEVATPGSVEVAPFRLASNDVEALAGHGREVIERVDPITTCAELHAVSLQGAAAVVSVMGELAVSPDLRDVPGEDLMHAGGIMLWLVAPNPSEPYGMWGDAALATWSAIEVQLGELTGDRSAATELDPEVATVVEDLEIEVVRDRYEALGCSSTDEVDAIAWHLGLPVGGVERDRAALTALSSLLDDVAVGSSGELMLLPLTADQRHRASLLLRLLHGPAQPDDDTTIAALLDDVRSTVSGLDTQGAVDEAMATLPIALAETSTAFVGDSGTCISLQLRESLVISSTDAGAPVVVTQRLDEYEAPSEDPLAGVDLPACEV